MSESVWCCWCVLQVLQPKRLGWVCTSTPGIWILPFPRPQLYSCMKDFEPSAGEGTTTALSGTRTPTGIPTILGDRYGSRCPLPMMMAPRIRNHITLSPNPKAWSSRGGREEALQLLAQVNVMLDSPLGASHSHLKAVHAQGSVAVPAAWVRDE